MNRSAKRGCWAKLNGYLKHAQKANEHTHAIFKQIAPLETSHCQGEIVGRYYYVLNSPFHPFDNPSYTMALWWTIERLS